MPLIIPLIVENNTTKVAKPYATYTKYTREGYISLFLKCLREGDKVKLHIEVEDTGIGIAKEDMDKLFTKFQRFDLGRGSGNEGSGLGLIITKSLVDLMNGTISVESSVGSGTKFTVEIIQGVVEKEVTQIEAAADENAKPFKLYNKRILVVDDNLVNLKVAARLLQDYNIESETVSSGRACLDKIEDGERYDLIFMDDMMPKMTGTECFEKLKQVPDFDTPVVALTANAITGMKERYLALGFDDYLPKPIVKNQLYKIMKKFLGSTIDFSDVKPNGSTPLTIEEEKEEEKIKDLPVLDLGEKKEESPKNEEVPKQEEVKEEIKEAPVLNSRRKERVDIDLDLPKEIELPEEASSVDDKTVALSMDQVKDIESTLDKK